MKNLKRATQLMLAFVMVFVGLNASIPVKAAPAPELKSIQIFDLALDDNNEIHIGVREIGTSKSGQRFVWCNGRLCQENFNEMQYLWGRDNIAYGCERYFHTGIFYTGNESGMSLDITAKFTNERSPWNTISASRTFQIP